MSWQWLDRADRFIFGDPNRLPRHLARAVIQEHDLSNRTGDYDLGLLRGTLHTGKPFYRREYTFDLEVRYSPFRLDLLRERSPVLQECEKPVLELRDYIMDSMQGRIVGALVGKYFLSVSLTQETDAAWQRAMPTDFYDHVFDFYRAMHEPVQTCILRRTDGEYVSTRSIAGPPEDPAAAT